MKMQPRILRCAQDDKPKAWRILRCAQDDKPEAAERAIFREILPLALRIGHGVRLNDRPEAVEGDYLSRTV